MNLDDPEFARFQRLSKTIDQFFEISAYGVAPRLKKDRRQRFKPSLTPKHLQLFSLERL